MALDAANSVKLVLGIDTCGPAGSVALGRLGPDGCEVLDQTALEGRTYSATLVAAISSLLTAHTVKLREIACIVVVSGPGSFTGVRVGISAAKGLSEGAEIPVVAVSRLAVLAEKSGVADAALDAHRHEVFVRLGDRELLAGAADLEQEIAPERVAVCDDAAAMLFSVTWPKTELVRVEPPNAGDAIQLARLRIEAADFDDVLMLDGHYLRRSDAEIFGDPALRP